MYPLLFIIPSSYHWVFLSLAQHWKHQKFTIWLEVGCTNCYNSVHQSDGCDFNATLSCSRSSLCFQFYIMMLRDSWSSSHWMLNVDHSLFTLLCKTLSRHQERIGGHSWRTESTEERRRGSREDWWEERGERYLLYEVWRLRRGEQVT